LICDFIVGAIQSGFDGFKNGWQIRVKHGFVKKFEGGYQPGGGSTMVHLDYGIGGDDRFIVRPAAWAT